MGEQVLQQLREHNGSNSSASDSTQLVVNSTLSKVRSRDACLPACACTHAGHVSSPEMLERARADQETIESLHADVANLIQDKR